MIKKVIKYCASFIGYSLVLGFGAPFMGVGEDVIETYKRPEHWIMSFIVTFVVYNILLYFEKLNPRTMYYCVDIAAMLAIGFFSVVLFVGIIMISIMEN
ncbi:MAG: hypothetical protein J6R40_01950, partial [Clostridia bacterium]|nr:hypothetical protein [Clostridia bacterium]